MNGEQRSFSVLDAINIASLILQVQSLQELHSQASSDDIYTELQKQDREYLERIVSNQREILNKLDKLLSQTDRSNH